MPTYTVKKAGSDSDHTWEVMCSWTELQEMCEEYGLETVITGAPSIIGGTGSNIGKAGEEWRNHLKNMKKNNGIGNTIKV